MQSHDQHWNDKKQSPPTISVPKRTQKFAFHTSSSRSPQVWGPWRPHTSVCITCRWRPSWEGTTVLIPMPPCVKPGFSSLPVISTPVDGNLRIPISQLPCRMPTSASKVSGSGVSSLGQLRNPKQSFENVPPPSIQSLLRRIRRLFDPFPCGSSPLDLPNS